MLLSKKKAQPTVCDFIAYIRGHCGSLTLEEDNHQVLRDLPGDFSGEAKQ